MGDAHQNKRFAKELAAIRNAYPRVKAAREAAAAAAAAPVEEAPAEAPVEEAPAEVVEAPAEEAPAEVEAPVEEAPVVEEPVAEEPVADEPVEAHVDPRNVSELRADAKEAGITGFSHMHRDELLAALAAEESTSV